MEIKRITTEALAAAWLKGAGFYDGLRIVERAGASYVVISATCGRCGGGGYGGWYPDGGICYDCRGRNTKNQVRHVGLKAYAQKAKARANAAAKNEANRVAKNAAAHERMIDGQRNWCEANGHGRVTFEERDAARAVEREAKKATMGWVGEVKKRQDFTATIVAIPTWAGYTYNSTTYCHIMVDEDGNKLVWKTADNGFYTDNNKAEVGDTVRFKATVKEHGERDGEKQTIVTRAKLIELVTKAVAEEAA